jgi:hypothetical protein
MRTIRLPLAGAVILSLSVGLAVGVAAETVTIPDGGASSITGTLVEPVHVNGPEPAPGEPGVVRNSWQYDIEWEDATLPTKAALVMSEDLHFIAGPDSFAIVCWGNLTIDDEDGYMTGPVRGFAYKDGRAELQAILEGGGAYEGLGVILTGPLGSHVGGPVEGVLFEGSVPQG